MGRINELTVDILKKEAIWVGMGKLLTFFLKKEEEEEEESSCLCTKVVCMDLI